MCWPVLTQGNWFGTRSNGVVSYLLYKNSRAVFISLLAGCGQGQQSGRWLQSYTSLLLEAGCSAKDREKERKLCENKIASLGRCLLKYQVLVAPITWGCKLNSAVSGMFHAANINSAETYTVHCSESYIKVPGVCSGVFMCLLSQIGRVGLVWKGAVS